MLRCVVDAASLARPMRSDHSDRIPAATSIDDTDRSAALVRPLRARPTWLARPDAAEKIAGATRYMTDLTVPGMLHVVIVRSPLAHARLTGIESGAARTMPGVAAVITADDVPGVNGFGILTPNQPVLAGDRVRFRGEAVALVVADTPERARHAAAAVRLDLDPLPVIADARSALAPQACPIHDGGNLAHVESMSRGDVEGALAGAAFVHEAEYATPAQWAAPLDTEGGLAVPRSDGGLDLFVGAQAARRDREQLARILAEPPETFRIVSSPTGGAFGAKDELTVQGHLALAVRVTGRPVRLVWHRTEAALAAIRRHAYWVRCRTGMSRDGELVAHAVEIVADTGAYDSLGPTVLFNSVEHAGGPYRIPAVAVDARLAYTNNGVAGACRGFGVPQIMFATERQIDALAHAAGLDPRAVRRRNLRTPSDPGSFGQRVAASDGARETFEALEHGPVLGASTASAARDDDRYLHGIGSASAYQCDGLGRGLPDPGAARLSLTRSGRIEIALGLEEFGQGTVASARLQVAERLGIAVDDVEVRLGDTALELDSGTTTASRGTSVVRMALDAIAERFTHDLLQAAGTVTGVRARPVRLVPGGLESDDGSRHTFEALARSLETLPERMARFAFPETPDGPDKSHLTFAYTASACRVRVDRVTGRIQVTDLDVATHCGPVADPLGYQGQMEGAAVMALGWTLTEAAGATAGAGAPSNFDGYALPGHADSPRITVLPCERVPDDDPHAKVGGAGEIGFDAVAPAVAAAVTAAIGVPVTSLPIRPEWVLDVLAARRD